MEPSEVRRRIDGYSSSASTLAARQWRKMRTVDDWPTIASRLTLMVQANMVAAARFSAGEAADALGSDAAVNPAAWGKAASDGRPLDSLLYSGVAHARGLYGSGRTDQQIMNAGLAWMQTIIGTQVGDAARSASGVVTTATEGAGWIRYVSPPCCQRCAVLAGKWFRWNEGFRRHPNCFPAGVVTSGPSVDAATRRWYEGELVVLSTASGQQLPVTGNHPILTRRGWVPANLIQEGDEVFRSTLPEGAAALEVPNHDQVPARIEDVWGSLAVAGLDAVPATPEDFHGDGQHGQVDVVLADRTLADGHLAQFAHHVQQGRLAGATWPPDPLDGQCPAPLLDLGLPAAARGSVSRPRLVLPLTFGHLAGSDLSSVAGVSAGYAGLQESFCDDIARDPVLARECVLAGSGEVRLDNGVGRQGEGFSRWDAPRGPLTLETAEGYARRGRDVLDRLSGQVEPDRIIQLVRREFRGHVFSLSTSEGWHGANSLIVSNCDCLHRPAKSREIPAGYRQAIADSEIRDLTDAQRQALAEGADRNRVLNAYRGSNSAAERLAMTTSRERGGVLTPEGIYRQAGDDRQRAIDLLRRHGYLL